MKLLTGNDTKCTYVYKIESTVTQDKGSKLYVIFLKKNMFFWTGGIFTSSLDNAKYQNSRPCCYDKEGF